MRIFHECVLDSFVQGGTTTAYTYTDPKFDVLLASAEKMAIFAIADQAQGANLTFKILVETSGDRRNWLAKNGGSVDMSFAPSANVTTSQPFLGYDINTNVASGFVRLNLQAVTSSGVGGARLRIFVTGHAEGMY